MMRLDSTFAVTLLQEERVPTIQRETGDLVAGKTDLLVEISMHCPNI